MTELDLIAALRVEADGLAALVDAADLDRPVPALGRWKVRDVVAHLGGVHRWATRVVETRSLDGPGFRKSKLDGGELVEWFRHGLAPLVMALDVDGDAPCPNFNPGSPSTLRFWQRRQLHETTVHRWDIERGLGRSGSIQPTIAADGIDEYLDVFVRTRGKQTLSAALCLEAADVGRSWCLAPSAKPGRLDIGGDPADSAAVLRGPAQGLLLHAWGRLDLEAAGLVVDGDVAVARTFRPDA